MTRRLAALVGGALILLLTACTKGTTSADSTSSAASTTTVQAVSSSSSSVATLPAAPVITNDLAQGSAHREVLVPGESFSLTVDYWLTTDPATWTSLGVKTVHFAAHTASTAAAADQATVMVEFAEITAVIRSTDVALDGQLIQSHRDAPATGAVPGYVITGDLPYEGVFGVSANSTTLLGRWSELGRPGPVDSAALLADGVYANEITFSYSLLIRGAGQPDDAFWHRRLVQDTLTIATPLG